MQSMWEIQIGNLCWGQTSICTHRSAREVNSSTTYKQSPGENLELVLTFSHSYLTPPIFFSLLQLFLTATLHPQSNFFTATWHPHLLTTFSHSYLAPPIFFSLLQLFLTVTWHPPSARSTSWQSSGREPMSPAPFGGSWLDSSLACLGFWNFQDKLNS